MDGVRLVARLFGVLGWITLAIGVVGVLVLASQWGKGERARMLGRRWIVVGILLLMAASCTPATAPQPKAPAAATTPTATARLFVQALLAGDVSGALSRMSVAAQSTYSSRLPALASALAPCSRSVMEVTGTSANLVMVQFTPACGDRQTVANSLFPDVKSKDAVTGMLTPGPFTLAQLEVQLVNEEWKVTMIVFQGI